MKLILKNIYRNIRRLILLIFLFFLHSLTFAQGLNHTWLVGYNNWPNKARFNFTSSSFQYIIEQRDMGFEGTQGNISDSNGNFLMSSNGVWIANANNDTMQNGTGLNPGAFVNSWSNGLPLPHANIILPWPDSSKKYILIHQTHNNTQSPSSELYFSVIDITLDNGLGEVIEKNIIFYQDNFAWGLNACKHSNGRDWWIVALSDSLNKIFTFLLSPNGIQFHSSQSFFFPAFHGTSGQAFSPDGKKFAFTNVISLNPGTYEHDLRLLDFDRCSGVFSNPQFLNLTDSIGGRSVAFSSNSKNLYFSKFDKIIQINTDTSDIASSLKIVAIYDGFISGVPPNCCNTDFWSMYLAANGKIYITSGSSVQHIHYINFPDLKDSLCDVQQHAIDLNGVWSFRAVPNHPNYYLGCDTTCTPCLLTPLGINEVSHDFKFNIYPNPSSGNFNVIYLLPQNKNGKLEVFDITGKVVYELRLPQWSTLQSISLSNYISNGLYNCVITSDGQRVSRKIAVIRE
jgi:hypothetical protein